MNLNTRPSGCVKVYADLLRKTTRLLTKEIYSKQESSVNSSSLSSGIAKFCLNIIDKDCQHCIETKPFPHVGKKCNKQTFRMLF